MNNLLFYLYWMLSNIRRIHSFKYICFFVKVFWLNFQVFFSDQPVFLLWNNIEDSYRIRAFTGRFWNVFYCRYLDKSTTWNGFIWIAYIVFLTEMQKRQTQRNGFALNWKTISQVLNLRLKCWIHSRYRRCEYQNNLSCLMKKAKSYNQHSPQN